MHKKTASLMAALVMSASLSAQAQHTTHPPKPGAELSVNTPTKRLDALRAAQPNARVVTSPGHVYPSMISGLRVATEGDTMQARAAQFLARWGEVIGVEVSELEAMETRAAAGRHSVRFQLSWQGVPVYGRGVTVKLDDSGVVRSLASDLAPVTGVRRGQLGDDAARLLAAHALLGPDAPRDLPTRAARVILMDAGGAEEVWMITMPPSAKLLRPLVFISTVDGRVVALRDHAAR